MASFKIDTDRGDVGYAIARFFDASIAGAVAGNLVANDTPFEFEVDPLQVEKYTLLVADIAGKHREKLDYLTKYFADSDSGYAKAKGFKLASSK